MWPHVRHYEPSLSVYLKSSPFSGFFLYHAGLAKIPSVQDSTQALGVSDEHVISIVMFRGTTSMITSTWGWKVISKVDGT